MDEEEQQNIENEEEMDVSERILNKCMPKKTDTEAKLRRMLDL